jgi:hypothetical protein
MIFKSVKEMQLYLQKNMDKMLEQLKSDKEFTNAIGEAIVDDVQSNMKKGIQVEENDQNGKKYDKLKPSTVQYREYLKATGNLSSMTSPSKAQNIATGELYDSLTYKNENGTISVAPKDDENISKAEYLKAMGRGFLKVSKKGVRQLKSITSKFIMEMLKKL